MGRPTEVVASAGRPVADIDAFAIDYRDANLGRLLVGRRGPGDRLSDGDRRLLEDLAGQCGAALYAAQEALQTRRLAADLQRAREQLVSAREEERRRIRRDLHDSLGAALGSQVLQIDVARARLETEPAATDRMLLELKAQSQDALAQVRRLARQLRPPELDERGLAGALALACTRAGSQLPVTLDAPELPELPAAVEVAAYLIAQEALTNVLRHAKAEACRVSLTCSGDSLELVVEDDGCGMPAGDRAGIGTASMRERAVELGGALTFESHGTGGTLVRASLPLPNGTVEPVRVP
jgi:signal transduction histidine kinase